jgi:hypothetical protein
MPYDNERARTVWQRVTATAAACPTADPAQLLDFLAETRQDSRAYSALAACVGGCDGAALRRIAGEKARAAKKLAAAYYLLTGMRPCTTPQPCCRVTCAAESLRQRYGAECRAAEDYAKASRLFSGQTAQLLEDLAKESVQTGRTVLCLLEHQM